MLFKQKKYEKITSEGQTLRVSISSQDSGNVPNLRVDFSAQNAAGNFIGNPQDWDKAIVDLYNSVRQAFKDAGFDESAGATQLGIRGRETSIGLEYPEHCTGSSLESAGGKVLERLGFEIPQQSMFPQREIKHQDRTTPPLAKELIIDWSGLRRNIEEKLVTAYGNSPKTQQLASDIVSDFKAALGMAGRKPPGAGSGN